jgi:hypothetical protein
MAVTVNIDDIRGNSKKEIEGKALEQTQEFFNTGSENLEIKDDKC